ncbi:uncharacterized protein LOC143452614 [Clavelina lepadiformis]|uniref:uncharacterized protein LOC143452614 n=1 Tax=Clavelina lepadiformis TaxID=159417 RepID=UPI0040422326
MDWNTVCFQVVEKGSPLVDYAFMGTPLAVLGEYWLGENFRRLSSAEIAIIVNSYGSDFEFRNEVYRIVEANNGVFYYQSPTRFLACGQCANLFLIVCAHGQAHFQCKRSVDRGMTYLEMVSRL